MTERLIKGCEMCIYENDDLWNASVPPKQKKKINK